MKLSVKVIPKASRNALAGWVGETLKVRVTAPPERGKANDAVEALLCRALGVARKDVRLVAGSRSAGKVFEIDGLDLPEIRRRLSDQMEKQSL